MIILKKNYLKFRLNYLRSIGSEKPIVGEYLNEYLKMSS